ncbi:MAG: DUF4298 domain-containing protein [Proteobacteria bacterium]|jgi:hypothetical protein|nr:DUF4298 domain-containing protein [Pseudomonadota bacterium]
MQEIERIQKMELALNELSKSQMALSAALEDLSQHQAQLKALSAYYSSEDFRHDLALDEAGKLPIDLKRGVLSEDAVYDLMTDLTELASQMHRVADELLTNLKP